MSHLSPYELQRMQASPSAKCAVCEKTVRKNYCRTCDEYFSDGHAPDCSSDLAKDEHKHDLHQAYC
jgi:hypothetical protein